MTRRVVARERGPLFCVRHDVDGGKDLWYHIGTTEALKLSVPQCYQWVSDSEAA
jgi:hypothetical protein